MDFWIYLNNNGLDIIDNKKGLFKFGFILSLFTLFCLYYKSITTYFICGTEIINNKYTSEVIPINEYQIKYQNLINVIKQKFIPCKNYLFLL